MKWKSTKKIERGAGELRKDDQRISPHPRGNIMLKKYLYLIIIILTAIAMAYGQGTPTPRDANEAEGWQIYNQYKASRAAEAAATSQIKQTFGDVQTTSLSTLGILGSDPSDRARLAALRQAVDAERQKQTQLLAKWGDKFYWRYGDLAWADDKIRDPGTKREMDRIEFALTYFSFDPKRPDAAAPPPGSTSLTLELPGYWGHLSYTISGAKLDPPSGGDRGNVAGRQYQGVLTGNTLTVSGNAVSENPSSGPGSGDYYELVVAVSVGKEHKEYSYIAPMGEKLSKSYSLSVPVTPGASGNFSIRLIEQNANYGPHGWVVGGSLTARTGAAVDRGPAPANVPAAANKPPSEPKTVFSTGNDYGVSNGGTPPSFVVKSLAAITQIMTYHWNGGRGAPGGTIALKNSDGKVFGPWQVTVRGNVYWEVNQKISLPPGTYTVIDSDPATWAQNAQSGGKGMVVIKGLEP
jgi:hypothetical protein